MKNIIHFFATNANEFDYESFMTESEK